eukprot:scaffold39146_cov63-Attheya_sp.AAC.3
MMLALEKSIGRPAMELVSRPTRTHGTSMESTNNGASNKNKYNETSTYEQQFQTTASKEMAVTRLPRDLKKSQ